MSDEKAGLPSTDLSHLAVAQMPLSLQIFFNDELFKRCQTIANYLADAGGFIAPHLRDKPKACFAVVSRALTWKLDPYAVAQATYETPGGGVGFFGTLCQAIIENSGRLDPSYGGVKYEHYGDWNKIRGRFRMVSKTAKGGNGTYLAPEQLWTPDDEVDLGVIVRCKVKDEDLPRELEFDMLEAFPRNSTLWITRPRQQICYTSVRAFGNTVVPSLLMGIPFDREDAQEWADTLKDVTPRPTRAEFGLPSSTSVAEAPTNGAPLSGVAGTATETTSGDDTATPGFSVIDLDGAETEFLSAEKAYDALHAHLIEARQTRGLAGIEASWEDNARLMADLRNAERDDLADALNELYGSLADAADHDPTPATAANDSPQDRKENSTGSDGATQTDPGQSIGQSTQAPVAGPDPQPGGMAAMPPVDARQGFPDGQAPAGGRPVFAVAIVKPHGKAPDWAKTKDALIASALACQSIEDLDRVRRESAATIAALRAASTAARNGDYGAFQMIFDSKERQLSEQR